MNDNINCRQNTAAQAEQETITTDTIKEESPDWDVNKKLRYSRQVILKQIGYEGQTKLLNSKVLVVGAGGLGCPILTYLAGAGVGTIGIVDFDTIGISNLNRQVLFGTDDVGKKKVDVAQEALLKLNPDVKIIKYPIRINVDNAEEIIQDYDVIVDALDNIPSRYVVSDCCYFLKKPLVTGGAMESYGIVRTILPNKSPCFRCLMPFPPKDGVLQTCSDVGVFGMVTGIIGSVQAMEVVKIIVGFGKLLDDRIIHFDGSTLKWNEIRLEKSERCPLCGKNPTITELVQYEVKCKIKGLD